MTNGSYSTFVDIPSELFKFFLFFNHVISHFIELLTYIHNQTTNVQIIVLNLKKVKIGWQKLAFLIESRV